MALEDSNRQNPRVRHVTLPEGGARYLSDLLTSAYAEEMGQTLLLTDEVNRPVGVLINVDEYNLLKEMSTLASNPEELEAMVKDRSFENEEYTTMEELFQTF